MKWRRPVVFVPLQALALVVWLIARKCNCYLNQIIGKRQANVYDLEKESVKQTPSHGEDTEMSTLIEERNVNNSEGQQNFFRRTDAVGALDTMSKRSSTVYIEKST